MILLYETYNDILAKKVYAFAKHRFGHLGEITLEETTKLALWIKPKKNKNVDNLERYCFYFAIGYKWSQ